MSPQATGIQAYKPSENLASTGSERLRGESLIRELHWLPNVTLLSLPIGLPMGNFIPQTSLIEFLC